MRVEGFSIRVIHRHLGGVFNEVFNWNTKKAGTSEEVLRYAINKFANTPPKGYDCRPLQDGDRLELVDLDSGNVYLYEMLDSITAQEL